MGPYLAALLNARERLRPLVFNQRARAGRQPALLAGKHHQKLALPAGNPASELAPR